MPNRTSDERDPSRQALLEALQNPKLRAELCRLHDEMFEKPAPAADGPIVRTGSRHRGRLIFGDALD